MRSLFCILLLVTSSALAQRSCPPGGTCLVNPLPTQGWRASSVPSPVPRRVARPLSKSHAGIIKVFCPEVMGTGYATGTIVKRYEKSAYVLTASHPLRGSAYVIAGGKRYDATIQGNDATLDVAMLKIADPGITTINIADKAPSQGEVISFWGYGNQQYRCTVGRLMSRVGKNQDWMRMQAVGRGGDSGAAFLNARGRIVGVLSSTNIQRRETVGCCFPRLRMFLRRVLPPYPNRPGVIVPKPVVVVPPVLPSPDPQPIDYDKLAAAILERLDLATLKGAKGDLGDKGDKGDAGDNGDTPVIDIDYITALVLAKFFDEENPLLPPVVLEIHHPDGKVFTQAKPLGVPLRIRLVPVSE